MPTIDDRTSTQSYAKPNVANTLQADVARLRSALDDIDGDMANALAGGVITSLTDIGAALADGDLFTVYDLSATTNRKAAATRIIDYVTTKLTAGISTDVTTTGVSTAARFVPTSSTVPTNGLYLPAANSVGIATNSFERMQIDSSGNVGIGVVPTAKLHAYTVVSGGGPVTSGTSDPNVITRLQGSSVVLDFGVYAAGQVWLQPRLASDFSVNFDLVLQRNGGGVCIGTSTLATKLTVADPVTANSFIPTSSTVPANGLYLPAANTVGIATGSSERIRIDSSGNVKVGGTADRATTAGTNQLVVFDGTAPVGTLTNGCSFYSTSGEMRVMDAAGNATLLSPHDSETNEWIYDSTDTTTGRRLRVDMEKLVKFLDAHFGLGFVQETFGTP